MRVFAAIGVVAVIVGVVKGAMAFAETWADPDYVQRAWERDHR